MDPEQELTDLRARVARLEALVERAVGGGPARDRDVAETVDGPNPEGFSRRRMLRNGLGLSAAAVAGVGMLDAVGSSAAAADGDAVTIGQTKSPTTVDSPPTRIANPSTVHFSAVLFQVDNNTDDSIPLPSDTRASILATMAGHDDNLKSEAAILGLATFGVGVKGHSEGDVGVVGTSDFGTGVSGTGSTTGVSGASASGTGVKADSTDGDALVATSGTGYAVHGTSSSLDAAILGDSTDGFGVVGNAGNGIGVGGSGKTGVLAGGADVGVDSTSAHGTAIKATSTDGVGVSATSIDGPGVVGTSGTAPGVHAVSDIGPGVKAESRTVAIEASSAEGGAIHATSSGSTTIDVRNSSPHEGIAVANLHETGNASGVVSSTANHGPAFAGFAGNRHGNQPAALFTTAGSGFGVEASSRLGVGGHFIGARAAIRLFPQKKSGHPTSGKHELGELLVAANGKLWLCTKTGTPGTWRQIAFV